MTTKNNGARPSPLPADLLDRMAGMLKLLAHTHRLRIVEILEHSDGAPVYEITRTLGLPQAVTSQHLNAMKRVGLLSANRRGKEVWYSIADPRALTILDCIRNKERKTR